MFAIDSLTVSNQRPGARSVSLWIQQQVERLGLVSSPLLGIGLALLGLLPMFLE